MSITQKSKIVNVLPKYYIYLTLKSSFFMRIDAVFLNKYPPITLIDVYFLLLKRRLILLQGQYFLLAILAFRHTFDSVQHRRYLS